MTTKQYSARLYRACAPLSSGAAGERHQAHTISTTNTNPDIWVLRFRAEGDGPPTAIRIRGLLKSALRRFGLRCTDHQLADPQPCSPQGLSVKPRNPGADGLPTSREAWEALPPAVEQAYRRGFAQAWLLAAEAVRHGAQADHLEDFAYGPLWRWRREGPMRYGKPPAFIHTGPRFNSGGLLRARLTQKTSGMAKRASEPAKWPSDEMPAEAGTT